MKRKSFTLIEILVGLIIISILASLSIASFRKTVAVNEEKACIENLKVLQGAIDIYTLENDALPASLALLTPRQINLAYFKVAGQTKENHLIAALKNIFRIKPALAQPLPPLSQYYGNNKKVFVCPADTRSPPSSCGAASCGPSYTFNFTADTYNSVTHKLIRTSTTPLVYDNASRHRGNALGITPGGCVGKANPSAVTGCQ
jgi:prepilin-type N-terminal cleavage/methylation domain-containing protein